MLTFLITLAEEDEEAIWQERIDKRNERKWKKEEEKEEAERLSPTRLLAAQEPAEFV